MSKQHLITDIGQLMTNRGIVRKQGRRIQKKDLSIFKNAAMVIENGAVIWVGAQAKLPSKYSTAKKQSAQGLNVFPGFVDCHTHMIFAGNRQDEFEMRNQGISYQEIARRGGGILSTMKATRKAKLQDLIDRGQERVDQHLSQGVTSIEIKSGYGLNRKTEEKMLEAVQGLKKARIVSTYLGAHAIPKDFASDKEYLEQLKKDLLLIKKKKLSQRVDIFVEKGYFGISGAKDYLNFAQQLGFDVTLHADQLTRTGAAVLGVKCGAKSVDHVIQLRASDKKKLSQSETVAVLLPTADFYLECAYPDARTLIDQSATVALATDFNPGSSPSQNIQLVGVLARLKMKMTLPEVFSALTFGGAKALGMEKQVGALLPGYKADFFLSKKNWSQFFYDLGETPVKKTYVGGRKI